MFVLSFSFLFLYLFSFLFLSFLTQEDYCVNMESMYVFISVISILANKYDDPLMQMRTLDAILIGSSHCCSHFRIQRSLDAYRSTGYLVPLHVSSKTLLVIAHVYMLQAFLSSTPRDIYTSLSLFYTRFLV